MEKKQTPDTSHLKQLYTELCSLENQRNFLEKRVDDYVTRLEKNNNGDKLDLNNGEYRYVICEKCGRFFACMSRKNYTKCKKCNSEELTRKIEDMKRNIEKVKQQIVLKRLEMIKKNSVKPLSLVIQEFIENNDVSLYSDKFRIDNCLPF